MSWLNGLAAQVSTFTKDVIADTLDGIDKRWLQRMMMMMMMIKFLR